MFIRRAQYEALLKAAAQSQALADRCDELQARLREATDRADRAMDAALAARGLPGITPPKPEVDQLPEGLFGDDPEVLAEWQRQKRSAVEELFVEGSARQ